MNSVYSVAQLNHYVKNMLAQDYLLNRISVRGEVSNYKDHPTGHIYFTLKDKDAVLSVVMFAGNRARGLKCRLQEGLKIVVTGSVEYYEASGKVSLYAREIQEEGMGDLYKRFQELKEKLTDMGMFDPAFKQPIPKYVKRVGIVTASSGAAVHDIVEIAHRRNPFVELILCPALVQGEGAPQSIISAIRRLDALHLDVMIVGRGGGSMEDLWAFNDEGVARAIFDAETPIISAVGHEVDFTIADFVADLRAPTPSAAAELAVFEYRDTMELLEGYRETLEGAMSRKLLMVKNRLEQDKRYLQQYHPAAILARNRERLSLSQLRLKDAMLRLFQDKKARYELLAARLDASSPLRKLTGGYGYIETSRGPLNSVKDAALEETLTITVIDGKLETRVAEIRE